MKPVVSRRLTTAQGLEASAFGWGGIRLESDAVGRRALRMRRRCAVRHAGAYARDHVGMSNDNAGEKPAHHKPEDS